MTRYLESSLPYRTLFMNAGLERYRERLLDAMPSCSSGSTWRGFYWGDCSLSNTLFRRDAGELQAYWWDAETSEFRETLADGQRKQDLMIMVENWRASSPTLAAHVELPRSLGVYDTGAVIRERTSGSGARPTREEAIAPGENYRIHERIRALNELGFSVGEFELIATGVGNQVRMRTSSRRDYHRHMLHSLTASSPGIARRRAMLNEVRELRPRYRAG